MRIRRYRGGHPTSFKPKQILKSPSDLGLETVSFGEIIIIEKYRGQFPVVIFRNPLYDLISLDKEIYDLLSEIPFLNTYNEIQLFRKKDKLKIMLVK